MKNSDFIISIGAALRNDSPAMKYAFNNVQKLNKGAGLYFNPVGDTLIPTFGKSVEVFNHKVGLEEAALYLVLDLFADKDKLPDDVKEYIESFKKSETKTITEKVEKTVKEIFSSVENIEYLKKIEDTLAEEKKERNVKKDDQYRSRIVHFVNNCLNQK